MPQDFAVGADNQQISQQKLKALRDQAKANGEVFPYDMTKVYATQSLVDARSIPTINKVGQELEVHDAIAKKLIAAGKATADAPKAEKAK